jgi:hypothetical protein
MSDDPQKFHDENRRYVEGQGNFKTDFSGIYRGKNNGEQLVNAPYKWKALPKLPLVGNPPIKQK